MTYGNLLISGSREQIVDLKMAVKWEGVFFFLFSYDTKKGQLANILTSTLCRYGLEVNLDSGAWGLSC